MGAPSQLQSSTETGQAGAGVTHPEGSSQCGVRGSEELSSRGRLVPKEPASSPGSSSGWQTWAEGPWAPPCVLHSRGPQVLPSWLAPSCPHGGGSLASAGSTEQVACADATGPCAHVALTPTPRAPPAEQNYGESRYHFLHSSDGEGCANMLVEYSTARGFRSEADMFVAQAVLQ